MECPHCRQHRLAPGRLLCAVCGRRYLRAIDLLRRQILALRSLADRQAHVGPRGRGSDRGHAPSPVDWRFDALWERAASTMVEYAAKVSDAYGHASPRKWRFAYDRIMASRRQLLSLPDAADDYAALLAVEQVFDSAMMDRSPRLVVVRCPVCGLVMDCPEWMNHGDCPRCATVLDLKALRGETMADAGRRTIEATPAQAARWATDAAGVRVTAKDVQNWLARGNLPSARRVRRGLWRINCRELLSCALDK